MILKIFQGKNKKRLMLSVPHNSQNGTLARVNRERYGPQCVTYGLRKPPGRNPGDKLPTMESFKYSSQTWGSPSQWRYARTAKAAAKQSSSYSVSQSDKTKVVKATSMEKAARDFLAQL